MLKYIFSLFLRVNTVYFPGYDFMSCLKMENIFSWLVVIGDDCFYYLSMKYMQSYLGENFVVYTS